MRVSATQIEDLIRASLPDSQVSVRDTTGGGDHYEAVVVSTAFHGKSLIERHRMIYAALGDLMRAEIHALALTTDTPEEYKRA
ncbi:MAG: BolA family transcriptional regulator [Deltaproteobacteria bacterium]|nr:BolA family transcriptional regulator [Deltaproteobacteria bacterium]